MRGITIKRASYLPVLNALHRLQLWVQPDDNTVLFDVCCGTCDAVGITSFGTNHRACTGTGSLGLSMARRCAHVVGVEMVQSAVRDAQANAEANGTSTSSIFVRM